MGGLLSDVSTVFTFQLGVRAHGSGLDNFGS